MSTLRERVRKTVSAHEPDDAAAARALQTILERAGTRRRARWPFVLAPALAAVLIALFLRHARSPEAHGVHLYLAIAGEPADHALTLDLDSSGDL